MKKLWLLPAAIAGVLAWYYWHQYEHWLAFATGSYNVPGIAHNYNFNSGFGSIVLPPMITLTGIALGFWWHHQCHVAGCFWYARKVTAAGDRACWIHHPDRKLTAHHIHVRHHEALNGTTKGPVEVVVEPPPSVPE
jgi:hypothetical protein